MTDLAGRGVRYVRVLHPDVYGNARSKEVPVGRLPSSIGYCAASLAEGLDGIPFIEGPSFMGGPSFPDAFAVPDLGTARIPPWEPDRAWVLADLIETGLCSRSALRRVIVRLAAAGFEAVCASEIEFYVLRDGAPYSSRHGMAYTTGRRSDPDGAVRRMLEGLDGLGLPVTTVLREFSPGQFEVNVLHGPALDAADTAFLLKEGLREIAAHEGLDVVFMAKPFEAEEGSSHHVHLSLWRDGANVFATDGGLLRQFAAGVIAHADALAAVCNPTINSYKRLGAEGMAPKTANLGGDDRWTTLRVPGEGGPAARLEVRLPDASSNPYLVYAAVLSAGLDGIERGLEVPAEFPPLPTSLGAALDALAGDTVVRAALGDDIADALDALKRRELERFGRAVTDWEWKEYGLSV
jgi:glutamine synthetase